MNSRRINEQSAAKVGQQQTTFEDVKSDASKAKANAKKQKDLKNNKLLAEVKSELDSEEIIKALEAIQEKGASSWLNILSIKQEVCIDVKDEPLIQVETWETFEAKTTKIEKDARLDIVAIGVRVRGQQTF